MSWKCLEPENDEYTYQYFLNEDVCRTCWRQNAVIEISSFSSNKQCESVGNGVTLAEQILQCTGVDVTFHPKPDKICLECCNEIENIFEFRKLFNETERKLHYILQKVPHKSQEETDCNEAEAERILSDFQNDIPKSKQDTETKFKVNLKTDFIKQDNLEGIVRDNSPTNEFSGLTIKLGNELVDPNSIFSSKPIPKPEPIEKFERTENCINLYSKDEFHRCFQGIDLEIKDGLYKCLRCEKMFPLLGCMLRHARESCKALKDSLKCYECGKFSPTNFICDHKKEPAVDVKHNSMKNGGQSRKNMELRQQRKVKTKTKLEQIRNNNQTSKLKNHTGTEKKGQINNQKEVMGEEVEFECQKCTMMFPSKELRRKHMYKHYNNVRPHHNLCHTCGRIFKTPWNLQLHIMIHEGKKMHVCPYPHCGYKATHESSLTYHVRRHTGERPYSCDQCPQRFATSSNFYKHKRVHHQAKVYLECNQCDKKFLYKDSLVEHISGTHQKSDPYTCADCGSIYLRFKNLQRHLSAKHGKRVRKLKKGAELDENEPCSDSVRVEFALGYEVVKENRGIAQCLENTHIGSNV